MNYLSILIIFALIIILYYLKNKYKPYESVKCETFYK